VCARGRDHKNSTEPRVAAAERRERREERGSRKETINKRVDNIF
jgi:hypothetical protein